MLRRPHHAPKGLALGPPLRAHSTWPPLSTHTAGHVTLPLTTESLVLAGPDIVKHKEEQSTGSTENGGFDGYRRLQVVLGCSGVVLGGCESGNVRLAHGLSTCSHVGYRT